ncbi:TPA: AAA family ATPase [Vibrio cholerae]|uniref:AAA family ATPase n=1 Tax=Vibrio cholerae TaxID=666 RepID=UPI0011D99F3A|nr:AAA family ATPase [Vibrio cholerae]TXX74540.1 AAA family ATPase [Vibrio cholerae]GIA32372.1 DNA replication and repair protein RecF [Vibrio cholerae]HCJ6811110.1 AAA family ATPase [Vibrio cholerae]HCJ7283006.1 AAA family ATPase [Vibrio cholerae]HCJ7314517.1 AAA family ATPase [Vibrio cholerae]
MINTIEIKNFKSALDLSLELGRVNVFIGENGSGKSTVLEALTMAGAAESNKLDTEFLELRGIRVTEPKFMYSAFKEMNESEKIEITLFKKMQNMCQRRFQLRNDFKIYSSWNCEIDFLVQEPSGKYVSTSDFESGFLSLIDSINERRMRLEKYSKQFSELLDRIKEVNNSEKDPELNLEFLDNIDSIQKENKALQQLELEVQNIKFRLSNVSEKSQVLFEDIKRFVIYSPQNEQLRDVVKDSKLQPIGIYGEGLFKLLQVIKEEQPEAMEDVYKGLKLFGWYQSIDLPTDHSFVDDELKIKDKYLLDTFSLKSTNEGFLYVLFYMALIVSKDTPKIFAVDNVDSALNPKLCSKIICLLTDLAKKYKKQIFLTTHNPALIDGINLHDEDQKLYVISRNKFGHTKAKQITADKKPKDSETGEPMRLSEAFLRGYLGGLPKGF